MIEDPLANLETSQQDNERIEKFLNEAAQIKNDEYFTQIASHLIKAGGKRQRPRFTIAAASAGMKKLEPVPDDVVKGGVAVELIQVGSLYHDDVIDEAQIRRSVDSVNARWDNARAILAGDYLLAKASEISAGLGEEVVKILSQTISKLCQGQVRELQTLYDTNRTKEQYLKSIEGKTSALFESATKIGGLVMDYEPTTVDLLRIFGQQYGMAFQIADDIMDLTLEESQLGKPTGNDISEGVYSLPVIYSLQEDGTELRELLHQNITDQERNEALKIIRNGNAINQAIKDARKYSDLAQKTILEVSDNQAAKALVQTSQNLIDSLELQQKNSN